MNFFKVRTWGEGRDKRGLEYLSSAYSVPDPMPDTQILNLILITSHVNYYLCIQHFINETHETQSHPGS